MELFSTILADFTEEDWQDVKDEIKEIMVDQFRQVMEENYIWNTEMMEAHVADNMEDYITNQFRELFNREDMKKIFMQEMMKQLKGVTNSEG